MLLPFFKYQGTGNDFVIVDNQDNAFSKLSSLSIQQLCDRRFGIGADGLMLLNKHPEYDFEMKYYNADGQEGSMCGNGGRCIVKFAAYLGIKNEEYTFLAPDGIHRARLLANGEVSLQMIDVKGIEKLPNNDYVLNTGSPHYVRYVSGINHIDVFTLGKRIRNSEPYETQGINVNFIEVLDANKIQVRTYERGVEDETFSCGTGVTAAAIVAGMELPETEIDIAIQTKGGALKVSYTKNAGDSITHIWLQGPATQVYSGLIEIHI